MDTVATARVSMEPVKAGKLTYRFIWGGADQVPASIDGGVAVVCPRREFVVTPACPRVRAFANKSVTASIVHTSQHYR